MSLYGKQQLYQQDADLMDILYLQDIDIGVVRDSFNDIYHAKLDSNAHQHEEKSLCYIPESAAEVLQSPCHYIVDGETGELVPVTLNNATDASTTECHSLPIADLLPDGLQIPHIDYSRQSSLDERLLDVYDLLGLPASSAGEPAANVVGGLYTTDALIATTPNDCLQYIDDSSATGQCMDILTEGLDSCYQFNVNGCAEQSVCLDTNGLIETGQLTISPSAISNNSMMIPPVSTPPAGRNNFDVEPDISDFFSVQGLDSEAMSLFIQGDPSQKDFIPRSTSFNPDQSTVHIVNPVVPFQYNTMVQDSVSVVGIIPSCTYPTTFPLASYNGLDTVHTMEVPALQQSAAAVDEILSPTEEVSAESLLQQVLMNELADPFDFDLVNDYNMADDGSSDSGISLLASQGDQVDDSQLAVLNPAMKARGRNNSSLPKSNIYPIAAVYDEAQVLKRRAQDPSPGSSSEYSDRDLSPVHSVKNIKRSRSAAKSVSKSRDKIEQQYGERDKAEISNRSRDEKRAKALKIPLSMDEIIDSSVEEFTELMNQHQLNDAQQQLIRDIRRRGKNKMAAQNCRKRKMEVIGTLEEQVVSLRDQRDILRQQRNDLDKKLASMQDRFRQLESQLFQHVRDKSGRLYDRNLHTILQTDDGGLFIIPRTNNSPLQEQQPTSADGAAHSEKTGRKRKAKEIN